MASCNSFKQHKAFKKRVHQKKKLILVAWHSKGWWVWSVPEYKKKQDKKLNKVAGIVLSKINLL